MPAEPRQGTQRRKEWLRGLVHVRTTYDGPDQVVYVDEKQLNDLIDRHIQAALRQSAARRT